MEKYNNPLNVHHNQLTALELKFTKQKTAIMS